MCGSGETMMTDDRRTAAGKNGRYNMENDGSSSGDGLASAPNRQWPCDCDVTRDDSGESAATDNSGGFNRGNGTTDNDLASAPNGNYDDGKNDDTTTIRWRERTTTGGYSCKTTRTMTKVIAFVLEFTHWV